jgi:hypothetical protein
MLQLIWFIKPIVIGVIKIKPKMRNTAFNAATPYHLQEKPIYTQKVDFD